MTDHLSPKTAPLSPMTDHLSPKMGHPPSPRRSARPASVAKPSRESIRESIRKSSPFGGMWFAAVLLAASLSLSSQVARGQSDTPSSPSASGSGPSSSGSGSASADAADETGVAAVVAALQRGDRDRAADIAEAFLRGAPDDPQRWQLAADAALRAGRVGRAVELYDRYAEANPRRVPYLWQRGIALTFAAEYGRGAEQFESHRLVNPNDVENATWHFLCVAKDDSVTEARGRLLPAPGDPRPPMKEVLEMFRGGETGPLTGLLQATPDDTPSGRRTRFYGFLYLAMLADAEGEIDQAKGHLDSSVAAAGNDYMGDVARVYRQILGDGDAVTANESDCPGARP